MAVEDAKQGLLKDALFRQMEAVYKWMLNQADSNGTFYGQTTRVIDDLNIARGQYSPIFKSLKEIGSVIQVKRGGGIGGVSEWQVVGPPSIEAYYKTKISGSNNTTRIGSVEEQLRRISVKQLKMEKDFLELFKLVKSMYDTLHPSNTIDDTNSNIILEQEIEDDYDFMG